MITDDTYLLKAKMAGISDGIIAKKLGITEGEVNRRFLTIQVEQCAAVNNGTYGLIAQFNLLCHQYQLMGQSLKVFAEALGKSASYNEVQKVVQLSEPTKVSENLLGSFLILKPFSPVMPEDSLRQSIEGN